MAELKYIEYGVASRVGKVVYINKRLKSYPKLKNALITHEKTHTDDFKMKDILLDVNVKELKGLKREYYKFVAENPSAWIEFVPIKVYDKTLVINPLLLLIWIFAGGLIWFILKTLL